MPKEKDIRLAITVRSEDDANRIMHVTRSMGFRNHDVFANPRETYQMASREQFDLFITFQSFPDMTGLTMIQSLRSTGNYGFESHLVLLDNLDPEIMVVLAEQNIRYVVQKPFDSVHIAQKLESLWKEESRLSPVEKLYREAHAALQSGLIDMAMELALRLIKDHKPSEKHLILLGDIFVKSARHEEARRFYQKARDAFSESYVPAHKMARLLMEEKRFAEAAPILDELARLSPLNLEILANTGLTNFEIGRYAESKAAMTRLKILDRARKDASELLARISIRAGDYRGSLQILEESHTAIELCEILHLEAQDLRDRSAFVRVIDFYLKHIEMLGNHSCLFDLYYRLGLAYEDICDKPNATRCIQKAIEIEPSYEPALLALRKLTS